MQPRGEPFFEVEDVTIDRRDVEALRSIAEHGSMNKAASALGRSYARIQQRVSTLEEAVGPLITRRRGGEGGGGSELTDNARRLIARFDRLCAEFSGMARSEESVFPGTVIKRMGSLALVEIEAGVVRGIVSGDADAVQVSIRSDAVALTTPAEAPQPAETSVRNQFRGAVSRIKCANGTACVTVNVGADTPLRTLVTETSLDSLELTVGDTVIASFKATATRAIPVFGAE
ncbi:TOBE domain-containing protein [Halobium palmae]|uniref:TOBE domain-containing protein n=1 Tax=Halobium palmae TaxID=1776492 RepID=A0ABD5RUS0_9EURY